MDPETTNVDETQVSEGVNDVAKGEAMDGTEYSVESPEVVAFKNIYPDVTDEAAIGSILNIHNTLAEGGTPAGEGIDEIITMINDKINATKPEPEEEVAETEPVAEPVGEEVETTEEKPGEEVEE
jgi:hypothetical protein